MSRSSVNEDSPFIIEEGEENEESISLQEVRQRNDDDNHDTEDNNSVSNVGSGSNNDGDTEPLLSSNDFNSSELVKESSRLTDSSETKLHIMSLDRDGDGSSRLPGD